MTFYHQRADSEFTQVVINRCLERSLGHKINRDLKWNSYVRSIDKYSEMMSGSLYHSTWSSQKLSTSVIQEQELTILYIPVSIRSKSVSTSLWVSNFFFFDSEGWSQWNAILTSTSSKFQDRSYTTYCNESSSLLRISLLRCEVHWNIFLPSNKF